MAGRALIPRAGALLASLALALGAADAGASAPKQRFFHSVGGAISCELDDGGGLGIDAYCQTVSPPRSVKMGATGAIKRCTGMGCIGNGPLNATTLASGHSVSLGPFKCTAATAEISCHVSSGAGFSISAAGVKRL